MRFLRTDTLTFEEFFDEQRPEYVILSHRWGQQEVSYQAFMDRSSLSGPGFDKIMKACELAQSRGHKYIWIDTCCIDKSSSAELSEAINSMFLWYRQSTECYAVLSDVSHQEDIDETRKTVPQSQWFKRGWTLQELIAPPAVLIFDAGWHLLGSKVDLAGEINRATGIQARFLEDNTTITEASVAMKMSWASRRQTTRIEDTAYCLLGLFNVNMPLLYGERENAFFRLQLEIIRSSSDETIFAWENAEKDTSGMLAAWPTAFANSGNIRRLNLKSEYRIPYSWTNRGLEFRMIERMHSGQNKSIDPMPAGQDEKYITLGCWEDTQTSSDAAKEASDKFTNYRSGSPILMIKLERKGTAWQRVHCTKMYFTTSFEYLPRSILASDYSTVCRYYYIPQEMSLEPAFDAW